MSPRGRECSSSCSNEMTTRSTSPTSRGFPRRCASASNLVEHQHRRYGLGVTEELAQPSRSLAEVGADHPVEPDDEHRQRHLAAQRPGGQRLATAWATMEQELRSALDPRSPQAIAQAPLLNQLGQTGAPGGGQDNRVQTVHRVDLQERPRQRGSHGGDRRCRAPVRVVGRKCTPKLPGNTGVALRGFAIGDLLSITHSILPATLAQRLQKAGQEVGISGHGGIVAQAFRA